jgi:hypothetical protein
MDGRRHLRLCLKVRWINAKPIAISNAISVAISIASSIDRLHLRREGTHMFQ